MKKLLRITVLSFISFLSAQTMYAQATKHPSKSKLIHRLTKIDTLNQMIKDSLAVKARYIKAGNDTMKYANAENDRLKAYFEKDPDFYDSEKGKQMANNVRNAQNANTFWGNKAFEIDVAVKNLEYEKTKITGTVGNPKLNIKRMPVKVDEKSGTITF